MRRSDNDIKLKRIHKTSSEGHAGEVMQTNYASADIFGSFYSV